MGNEYNSSKTTFKKLDFFILTNTILDSATKKYVKDFDSLYIPFAYLTMYFEECTLQNKEKDSYLYKFLLCFNNNNIPFDTIVGIFNQSKKPNYYIKDITRNKLLSGLKAGKYVLANRAGLRETLTYEFDGDDMKNAYESLQTILNEINQKHKNESITYKYKYSTTKKNENNKKTSKTIKAPRQIPPKRVEKLVIPQIPIDNTFPKSQNLSRVDSRYFAYSFCHPADEVTLILKYHINLVKLSAGFLSKRQAVMDTSSKKSSFDDFF